MCSFGAWGEETLKVFTRTKINHSVALGFAKMYLHTPSIMNSAPVEGFALLLALPRILRPPRIYQHLADSTHKRTSPA